MKRTQREGTAKSVEGTEKSRAWVVRSSRIPGASGVDRRRVREALGKNKLCP